MVDVSQLPRFPTPPQSFSNLPGGLGAGRPLVPMFVPPPVQPTALPVAPTQALPGPFGPGRPVGAIPPMQGPPARPVTPIPASAAPAPAPAPAPGGSKPAGSAPAPKSPVPAQQLLGIPQGRLSPREAQILLAAPAPMSPDLAAQYQILNYHTNTFQNSLARSTANYNKLLENAKTDQDRKNAEDIRNSQHSDAVNAMIRGMSDVALFGNPQGQIIRNSLPQQNVGMPDGSGIQ